jgi:hypothetical protein
MRAFLATTGVIFLLIVIAHIARVVDEGTRLLYEPEFLPLTGLALGMAIWAGVLFRRSS